MLGQLNDLESVKIADFGFAIEVATPEARDKVPAWTWQLKPYCQCKRREGKASVRAAVETC